MREEKSSLYSFNLENKKLISIGVMEMFTTAKAIAASQKNMTAFIAAGIFYYVFNLLVAMVMEHIEKKMNYYH